jgi:hypothetical protein
MPRRIDLGRAVLFAGSALLFVSLFTEWYDTGQSGWQVFETLDMVLAALAIAGLVAAVRSETLPGWTGAAVPGAALVIVLLQLIDGPPASGGADPSSGAWVALAGTFLMAAGAALSLAAISVTIQVRERDVRRRVAAVDRREGREGRAADEDADLAEDLDADAEGPVGAARKPSLFSGLGRGPASAGDGPGDVGGAGARPVPPPPPRPAPRQSPPSAPASAPGDDLERTQPLSRLPDDEEDTDRP